MKNGTFRKLIMSAITSAAFAMGVSAASAEEWVVHAEPEFPPYNFMKDGKFTGIDTEIVERVLKEVGGTPKYELTPWKRVVQAVDENTTDISFQFAPKPERFEKYWMVGPIRQGKTVFFVPKGKPVPFEKLEDLKEKTIGIVNGYAYTPEFDAATFLNKQAANDNDTNVKKLAAGRLDMIIGDYNTINDVAKRNGVADQIEMLKVIKEVPRYVAFPRQRQDKADKFAAALKALQASGEIDKILAKW